MSPAAFGMGTFTVGQRCSAQGGHCWAQPAADPSCSPQGQRGAAPIVPAATGRCRPGFLRGEQLAGEGRADAAPRSGMVPGWPLSLSPQLPGALPAVSAVPGAHPVPRAGLGAHTWCGAWIGLAAGSGGYRERRGRRVLRSCRSCRAG